MSAPIHELALLASGRSLLSQSSCEKCTGRYSDRNMSLYVSSTRRTRTFVASAVLLAMGIGVGAVAGSYEASSVVPPQPMREFRGAWVATVGNIDWPSSKGLSTAEQKTEMVAILDRAAELRLNAIIFQVGPACDALYAAAIEPW